MKILIAFALFYISSLFAQEAAMISCSMVNGASQYSYVITKISDDSYMFHSQDRTTLKLDLILESVSPVVWPLNTDVELADFYSLDGGWVLRLFLSKEYRATGKAEFYGANGPLMAIEYTLENCTGTLL